jgi:hypothetical protein
MKDSKEGSEYKMKRNSPEWKIEMEITGEDKCHTQEGEKKHDMERNWGDTGKTYVTEVTLTPDDTYKV